MSRHEGVSCDSCLKGNFRGRRFKCLICYDFDLCAACYESGTSTSHHSNSHSSSHAMQCILTRTDHELFYTGENAAGIAHSQSLTCPFCGKLGFTEATLVDHVSSAHTDSSHDSQEVICPICASTPGDDPNYFVSRSDFSTHINLEHRSTGQRDLISFLDEPSRSGAGVRRVGRGGSSNGTGSARARRTANVHHHPVQATVRESVVASADPIAELLSQLSGVRRSASSSSSSSQQLQHLQMQLQLERQRQRGLHQYHSMTGNASSNNDNPSAMASAAAAAAHGMIINSSSTAGPSHPMPMGSHLWTNVPSNSAASGGLGAASAAAAAAIVTSAKGGNNTTSGAFLLSQLSDEDQSEDGSEERKKRSLFVEELVLASLANCKIEDEDQNVNK